MDRNRQFFFSHFRPFFSLMMYGSWNIKRDRHIFLSFCTIFCSFVPIATQNIKILKKWRKSWRCHYFSQVHQKSWSYAILFLKYGVWRITAIFNLGYFLSFYLPNSLKNQNLKQTNKKTRNIINLHICTKN